LRVEEVDRGTERRDDAIGPIRSRLGGRRDDRGDMVGNRVEGGEESLLLGPEVLVEDAVGDRRPFGDLGDRDVAIAPLGDQLSGRSDPPLVLGIDYSLTRKHITATI